MLIWLIDETVLQQIMTGVSTPVLLVIIVLCIAALSKGADWMVTGVVHLAERTGLPRIVISATIVSLGTTTPEAFVSVMAAFMGNPGLALGNGVGSIIADTGLIFGIACLLSEVPIHRFILNRMGWVQVGSATLLVAISAVLALAADGAPSLPRWVGILFLMLLVGYMYMAYRWSLERGSLPSENPAPAGGPTPPSIGFCMLLLFGGLAIVVLSARVLVPSASEIAFRLGVPEDVVAATMVALGTSLPELITAIVAVRKKHPEIVVGNVIGADVLNCLFVIGAAASAKPLAIPSNFFYFHFPAMLAVLYSLRCFIAFNRKNRFYRWQGAWLLGIYLVYVISQYVWTMGTAHP
jgi:cation:H+ antiporter